MELSHRIFGKTPAGEEVDEFTFTNRNGMSFSVLSFGATLSSVKTVDAHERAEEITLGFDTLDGYLGRHPYFGATVGRVANRIAKSSFSLDGAAYSLMANDGANHLHGGGRGFDHIVWQVSPFAKEVQAGARFTYLSRDGEEGYPGNLTVEVTYTLDEGDDLTILYEATTDRPTPVNLTNHTYWNLKGAGNGTILDHRITIFADSYLPVDAELIPTGELRKVTGTPFNFRAERAIGKSIEAAGGYDHCFVIKRKGEGLAKAARVYEPSSGRGFEVHTTLPGVQFYTGNFLDGSFVGRGGKRFERHGAFCLETEGFPDAVNRPTFPSVILRPGQRYRSATKLHFFCQ